MSLLYRLEMFSVFGQIGRCQDSMENIVYIK